MSRTDYRNSEEELGIHLLAGLGGLLIVGLLLLISMAFFKILDDGLLLEPIFVGYVYGTVSTYIVYRLYLYIEIE